MPKRGWSALLSRPVPVKDGKLIRTLNDARQLALANKATGGRTSWQSAAGLMLTAAETGAAIDIEAATKQLELALLLEGRLKL
jgi:hypothetical protein